MTYIGFALAVIEHIIGIYTGEEKGLTTVWLSILCALGMTFAGNNLFESIAICLCFENVICFGLGIILVAVTGVAMSKTQKKTNSSVETNKVNSIEKNKNIEEYEKLLDIIKAGSGITDLDNAIQTFFEFYMKKNIPIPLELVITKDKSIIQKYENLLRILEIGIGVKGIKNVQERLFD